MQPLDQTALSGIIAADENINGSEINRRVFNSLKALDPHRLEAQGFDLCVWGHGELLILYENPG
jgi:hypothetical protein